MAQNPQPLKRRAGRIAAVVTAVLAAIATVLGVTVYVPHTQQTPSYLATAVYPPGSALGDANLNVYRDGRIEVQPARYDKGGHATMPEWRGSCPLGVPCAAPLMGWNVTFMREVAQQQRGVRYCAEALRQYDTRTGLNTTAIGVQAVHDVFENELNIPNSTEDCNQPDLILGFDAEVAPPNCGANAWGCASLDLSRRFIRVTFNGSEAAAGRMIPNAIRGVFWHELKHAGDLGHTGPYGNEGRNHPHCSDLGYINWNGQPYDNPSDMPCVEDWHNESGNGFLYGLSARDPNPTPRPTPSPQPTPTPEPTPEPTAPPVAITKARVLEVVAARYWELIAERELAPTLDAAIAADLRAQGAADVYWRIADTFSDEVLGATRQPAPPRPQVPRVPGRR